MSNELYSEGIKHLSSILLKAQGRLDAENMAEIDVGYEIMRLREVLDGMNAKPKLPQDVENSSKDEMRELFEYGCTHTKAAQFPLGTVTLNGRFHHYTDSDTDSAWIGFVLGYVSANKAHAGRMTDHVRVPVELIEGIRAILPGCSNNGCAFANRPPGSMGTNAMCNCIGNATRQQLMALNRKITALLNASKGG